MIKETPYPMKKLILYFEPEKLSISGGTIKNAVFQKPKLLEYLIKFPRGFDFPPFLKISKTNNEITLGFSENHSGKNEIIFTGLSSRLYSKLMSKQTLDTKINAMNSFRFQVLLEQQSIISLVSELETFIKSVRDDHIHNQQNQNNYISHNFKKVEKVLSKCEIEIRKLEYLSDNKIHSRTEEIIDYAFNLRNLFVHNGGIVDKSFYEKYKDKISLDKIGTLIRVEYSDYEVIRQWLSFFIQEICRVIEGYDNVWTDYLLSNGIMLPNHNIILKAHNGEEYNIPLEDGIELIGIYDDESETESIEKKPDRDEKTYSFQLDIGKFIEYKTSKTQ